MSRLTLRSCQLLVAVVVLGLLHLLATVASSLPLHMLLPPFLLFQSGSTSQPYRVRLVLDRRDLDTSGDHAPCGSPILAILRSARGRLCAKGSPRLLVRRRQPRGRRDGQCDPRTM